MKINSLGLKTNLILNSMSSNVMKRSDYIVIHTPSRPNYIWGNYIAILKIPDKEQYKNLVAIFKKEIHAKSNVKSIAITFDASLKGDICINDFIKNGFDIYTSKVLIAKRVSIPSKLNNQIIVKEFSKDDWSSSIDIHYEDDWKYGKKNEQIDFLQEEAKSFKSIVSDGKALRYGAFLNNELMTSWALSVIT